MAAIAMVRLAMLATYPLMDTTEARYADIAQIMADKNDWITPWFRPGVPFWGKPPLSFWATVISFKLFGANEFTARFPHWILGIIGGWFVWDLGIRRSKREAVIAISLLSGCLIYYFASGAVMTDMALTLGLVVSMWSFWLSVQSASEYPRSGGVIWLFFVSLGWGLLAKGPLAIVLAFLAIGAWLLFNRSFFPAVVRLPWIRGPLLSLLVAAPWYWAAEAKTPGFLNYFLIGEHINRFLVPGWNGDLYGNAHHHAHGTIWIYLIYMLIPWTILLPLFLFYRNRRLSLPISQHQAPFAVAGDDGWRNYLLCWGLAPAVFFTFSRNIIMPYVLPGIPALALLGGYYLVRFDPARVDRLLTLGLRIILIGSLLFMLVFPLTGYGERKSQRSLVNVYSRLSQPGSRLVYWDQYPFSAGFYSRDRVVSVFDKQQLTAQLDQPGRLYLALGRGDQSLLQSSEFVGKFDRIKDFRRYSLYRESIASAKT
ncbi:glycosyltransferase family 39 protein [Cyanobium sp. HWJ4-Hawea]|uniref:ArnT family glycosyltransferase n=1 Tax=Cyanobium sp. HWJ4-Hawea TaxID=2823713 RepID=UPI0020CF7260|nr:glycosyltransferase family 39 protein [Cyanobium sp. HWJ4-Hawea]MCP9810252.1 glycosyltransferase family 39 protein [Cyanobium sp. HWJ4-Hawea]